MRKKKVALIAGGYTKEAAISIKSAENVIKHIDPQKYDVYTIILEPRNWYHPIDKKKIPVDKSDFSITINNEKIVFDVAFIMVHGSPGEDGKLQGYLDLLKIPYTSCNTTTSALTMNKAYTKFVASTIAGLNSAECVILFKNQPYDLDAIQKKLHFPVFVKPNNGGSSIGMSKVVDPAGLPSAIKKAFAEDSQILIEEFIRGREFTVGVVRLNNEIKVLPVTEIITNRDFFDHEAKYTPGVAQEITPANLTSPELAIVKKVVTEAYQLLNCNGVVRIDFILENNTSYFYFIEINTIPGQTDTSLIPQQVRAMGSTMMQFYSQLIEQTLALKK